MTVEAKPECDCASLRAAVERLQQAVLSLDDSRGAALTRLAAAEALLQKALDHANEWPDPDNGKYSRALVDFLATSG
jgi:predicted negative regulator of RcsB-dependent stress response